MVTPTYTPDTASAVSSVSTIKYMPDEAGIAKYRHLIDRVLYGIARHLPTHIELDDLRSEGLLGLISALQRYDTKQQQTFEAYAMLRIRGAILDELRRRDCLPRSSRAKARYLRDTVQSLEQELGRTPTDTELTEKMGISGDEYRKLRRLAHAPTFVSLDQPISNSEENETMWHDTLADDRQAPCYESLQTSERSKVVLEHLHRLPERQQRILSMLYFEGCKVGQVAEAFGVTEARICQLRTHALERLRKTLWKEENCAPSASCCN